LGCAPPSRVYGAAFCRCRTSCGECDTCWSGNEWTTNTVLRGHYAYYGIAGNIRALQRCRAVERYWHKMLGSRSRQGYFTLDKFQPVKTPLPLLAPKAVTPLSGAASSRGAVTQLLKSAVQENCAPRSVGAGGGDRFRRPGGRPLLSVPTADPRPTAVVRWPGKSAAFSKPEKRRAWDTLPVHPEGPSAPINHSMRVLLLERASSDPNRGDRYKGIAHEFFARMKSFCRGPKVALDIRQGQRSGNRLENERHCKKSSNRLQRGEKLHDR
jgi:hypothetical protein